MERIKQRLRDVTRNPGKRPVLLERTPFTVNVMAPLVITAMVRTLITEVISADH